MTNQRQQETHRHSSKTRGSIMNISIINPQSTQPPSIVQGRNTMQFPTSTNVPTNQSLGDMLFLGFPENIEHGDLLSFVKEHNSTLNFPQKLMLMLTHVYSQKPNDRGMDCISWTRDGHSFIIRNRNEFVGKLLPLFFREAKFSSFTRKLYRWGFRQICIPKSLNRKERDMVFGHEYFQRDQKYLISNMRSVTAAGTRRAIVALTARKKAKTAAKSRPAVIIERDTISRTPSLISANDQTKDEGLNLVVEKTESPISVQKIVAETNILPRALPLQNSAATSSALAALIMSSPLLSLQSISALQNQISYLEAIARSKVAAPVSTLISPRFSPFPAPSSAAGTAALSLIDLQKLVNVNKLNPQLKR